MGAAHAQSLVAEGARVIIGDIRDDAGKAVAENLGDSAYFVHLDVTDPEQWDAAVDAAVTKRLDALVMDPPLKGRACGLPLAVSSLPLGLLLPP